tara:strand:+ start:4340 stop:4858 length:519 start_codon:yes stop_codon:yes gene_type:complete
MKKISIIFTLMAVIGCTATQSNIKIDSIETFSLDNYNDFNIKINNSNIGAEVNPIVIEKFKENLKNAIQERGLTFNKESNLIFDINFTTKDKVESDRSSNFYYGHSWNYYMHGYDAVTRTETENILRVNLRDLKEDKTVWTVVTVWRDGSSRSISYDDASNILVDEIMLSFL